MLLYESERSTVVAGVVAARESHIVILSDTRGALYLVEPVGVAAEVCSGQSHLLGCSTVGISTEHLDVLEHFVHTDGTVVGDGTYSILTLRCGHYDDACGTA